MNTLNQDSKIVENRISSILANYSKHTSIVESDIGVQNIVFDNLSENVFVMNVTAKIIWHTLKNNTTLNELVDVLTKWFTGGLNYDEVLDDIGDYLEKLQAEGLIFVGETKSKGSFPIGREINITQNLKAVQYEKPVLIKYDRNKLKEKHPEIFYSTQFSDTWGPATIVA